MSGTTINIRSRDGGKFHCYLVVPEADDPTPAVVLASAVHGVDVDIRAIADEFAAHGFIAAAPDLFWRSVPGPLSRGDDRAVQRSQPRLEKINAGEGDMADTLAHLSTLLKFNGRAVAMGFCYGGPYAILGPKRRAGRLSRYTVAHEERGSAHLFGRAPRLHDAREPEGFRRCDVRVFDQACDGDPRRF